MTSTPVNGSFVVPNVNMQQSKAQAGKKNEFTDFKSFMSQSFTNTEIKDSTSQTLKKDNVGMDTNEQRMKSGHNVRKAKDVLGQAQISEEKVEETANEIVKAIETVKETICKELNVSEEDIENALANLSMTLFALLDSDSLPIVVAELTGNEDVISLVTDETAFGQLSNILEAQKNVLNDIADLYGISEAELKEEFSKFEAYYETATSKPADNELTENALNVSEEIEDPKAELANKVEIEVSKETKPVRKDIKTEDGLNVKTENSDSSEPIIKAVNELNHGKSKSNGNTSENMNFAQTVVERVTQLLNEAAKDMEVSYTNVDAAEVINQITDSIRTSITQDMTEVNLRLHPESLGTVNVKISANNEGVLTAQFTAQNESVKAVIESQAIVLKETLESKGVTVEAVEVLLQSHEFERNLSDQSRGQEHEAAKGSRRIRRISISDDNPDNLDEEDSLAREMMIQNGNTIDYSA